MAQRRNPTITLEERDKYLPNNCLLSEAWLEITYETSRVWRLCLLECGKKSTIAIDTRSNTTKSNGLEIAVEFPCFHLWKPPNFV
jgi:hypothetical protein